MTKIEALELELKARKMVEGTKLDWWSVIRMAGLKRAPQFSSEPEFSEPVNDYELALGIIDDKPVWKGDTYYSPEGIKLVASGTTTPRYWARCSWNLPKPKTVMVELLVGDAETWANCGNYNTARMHLIEACRKALEEMHTLYHHTRCC